MDALQKLRSRPLPDALVRAALFGLLAALGASSKTRPTAERWMRALEEAARIAGGTLLTTGIAPWDRAWRAAVPVESTAAERGRRVSRDRLPS